MEMQFWFPQLWETLPKRSTSHPIQITEVYCVTEGGSVWAVAGRAAGGHQRDVLPTNRTGIGFPKRTILVRNDSSVTEFLLAGLTDRPELQQPLFFLFLMIYIVTVVGNLGLIILIGLNSHLHTPMYYFLFNLSFIDLCYSSVFTPKMLMNFVSRENIISYVGCMAQLFFFLFFVISECYMLTSMAYDRYVAICHPLLYRVTMSHQVCCLLTVAAYMMGFAGASAHTGCMLRLTFCHVNIINHYLCDILPLLQLSCTSTYVNEVVVLIVVGINITVPSFTILISYVFILTSILHIRSAQGRSKAFSTCSSHIIALSLFFGSAAFMYLKYSSPGSMEQGKVSSIFYTNVGSMLNPLIYSLRNKDVKIALKKALINLEEKHVLIRSSNNIKKPSVFRVNLYASQRLVMAVAVLEGDPERKSWLLTHSVFVELGDGGD
ncbi:LOW QUALITY PROTEIN: olfactory receptor 8B3-like [Lontra canadensis]|uniref:LOW QUALITY PROTEIN: olfactory receptor 8B3-like n=1 Tax=Lontra canadensis TaxID=76717 RepID=UPI0013F34FEE|nr:LOW QUALITY PROTEIN: olfactory receptor 8B3-like [Lontra canadensis]